MDFFKPMTGTAEADFTLKPQGKQTEVIAGIETQMQQASERMEYEQAALLRVDLVDEAAAGQRREGEKEGPAQAHAVVSEVAEAAMIHYEPVRHGQGRTPR